MFCYNKESNEHWNIIFNQAEPRNFFDPRKTIFENVQPQLMISKIEFCIIIFNWLRTGNRN